MRQGSASTTSAAETTAWRLGTIGFAYADWNGVFYPQNASPRQRLSLYAQQLTAVEIDSTFYAVPRPETVRRWADAVPDTFRFSLKAPRAVTHEGDPTRPDASDLMRSFLDAARELEGKLGVVLLQFPPTFHNEGDQPARLEALLRVLPTDLRYALELRHDGWWTPRIAEMLRRLNREGLRITWVGADQATGSLAAMAPDDESAGRLCQPRGIYVVSDFLYLRWVGAQGHYHSDDHERIDPTPRLRWWADRVRRILDSGPGMREIWGCFGNSFAGHGPATLRRFAELMGITMQAPDAASTLPQGRLF